MAEKSHFPTNEFSKLMSNNAQTTLRAVQNIGDLANTVDSISTQQATQATTLVQLQAEIATLNTEVASLNTKSNNSNLLAGHWTNGQLLIGNTTEDGPDLATLTAGANVTITNGAGSITVAASSGGGALTLISEVVTTASQASVTFSTISGSYRDLLVVIRGRSDKAAVTFDNILVQLNGDTGSNYYWEQANATGPSAVTVDSFDSNGTATSMQLGSLPAATAPAGSVGLNQIRIGDYSHTNWHKSLVFNSFASWANTGGNQLSHYGGARWANTAAVTSVKVFPAGGNWVDNSVVSLYGSL